MPAHSKQIAIIGAGPAGSVAAIRLAQLGYRVTLFEKANFPRDKVCGECLSATGIAVLQRLGIADIIERAASPVRLRRASAVAADGSQVSVDLPATMWGLTRRTMDAVLAGEATRAGVEVFTETTAHLRSMAVPAMRHGRDAHATKTVVATSKSGVTTEHHPDVVMIADGCGRALGQPMLTGDFGIKAHFRDVDAPRDTIELVTLSRGYAGLAPVNDDLWNAAWSVPAESLKHYHGDIDALFRSELERSPTLRRRFAHATQVGAWLACPLPRYAVRREWPSNVIPLGNAAAALEPVGGEGMGLAMRSAELAADAIDAAARSGQSIDARALRKQFDHLWRIRRAACRGGAIALSHRFFGPLTVGIAQRSPALARAGLALTGK